MKDLRFSTIWTIAKKELKEMFDSPTAYIVLGVFLLLWEYLAFPSFFQIGSATLTPFFALLPWMFVLFIPAVMMRSISQEKEQGTLELVLTHPVTDLEFILAKFLAGLIFAAIALALTVPIVLIAQFWGHFDWGIVVSQYLGGLYLAAILVSLSLFVSSAFRSPITSLMVSVVASFVLTAIGFSFFTSRLPLAFAGPIADISVLNHFARFARGVIDLKDILYGILMLVTFLSLAFLELRRLKFGPKAKAYRSLRTGVILIIAITVATSIIGARIPGRIDLTAGHLYTLSSGTRNILGSLTDVVRVNIYASSKLPPQMQPKLNDVKDMLADYRSAGHGDIIVQTKNPSANGEARSEAVRYGIQPVQFNTFGQGEFQAKSGYFGIAIVYGNQHETIPYISETNDLEYRLTSAIHKLTTKTKSTIGYLTGQGEKALASDYSSLKTELEKQFILKTVTIDDKNPTIDQSIKTLIIAGPTQPFSDTAKKALTHYLNQGGSALFLVSPFTANTQTLSAAANKNSFADYFSQYGLTVNNNIVFDLRSNENIALNTRQGQLILPYPFWVKALAGRDKSVVTANLSTIILPWASSITIDKAKLKDEQAGAQKLFVTSPYAGVRTPGGGNGSISIAPNQQFPTDKSSLSEKTVALAFTAKKPAARFILVGNSDFLTDSFVRQVPEDLSFGISAVEWLGQSADLAGIRARNTQTRPLQISGAWEASELEYGNFAFVILFAVIFGSVRLMRRRRKTRQVYTL